MSNNILLPGFDRLSGDLSSNMIFHAADVGDIDLLEKIIMAGVNPNINGTCMLNSGQYTGFTPLSLAARQGHAGCVKFLLEQGANPNQQVVAIGGVSKKTIHDSNALILSSWTGHTACVKLLLEHGADVDSRDDSQSTALLLACNMLGQKLHQKKQGSLDDYLNVIKVLIHYNSNMNAQDSVGSTPLSHLLTRLFVINHNDYDLITTFLEHGANPNICANSVGQSARDIAINFDRQDVLQLFKSFDDKKRLIQQSGPLMDHLMPSFDF